MAKDTRILHGKRQLVAVEQHLIFDEIPQNKNNPGEKVWDEWDVLLRYRPCFSSPSHQTLIIVLN